MSNAKKLYRSKSDRIIFGVCGGLGEYFEVDPLIIRILFVLLVFTGGSGIIIYLILAVIIPDGEAQKLKGKEAKEAVQEKVQGEINGNSYWLKSFKNVVGMVIAFIGLNILFEQAFGFGLFNWINWGIIWALIIILIGVKIIFNNKQ